MADRNDELLLKLGWTRFKHRWKSQHATRPSERIAQSYYKYRNLAGDVVPENDRPRPYNNLQDAVDCVPEGWSTSNVYQDTDVGKWLWMLENEDREVFAWAVKPSEALSEAIAKAVDHE